MGGARTEVATEAVKLSDGQEVPQYLLDLPVSEMTFHHNPWVTTRVRNVLQQNGIQTLGQLLGCSWDVLMDMRNFGAISLAHVKTKLEGMGLKLKEPGW